MDQRTTAERLFNSFNLCVCVFLPQDGVMVLSGTHRYKKKYVTTLLYKPIWVESSEDSSTQCVHWVHVATYISSALFDT